MGKGTRMRTATVLIVVKIPVSVNRKTHRGEPSGVPEETPEGGVK